MFLEIRTFLFLDASFVEKNPRRARRHSRKGVGPKAPGAHRAHFQKNHNSDREGPVFRRTMTVTGEVQFLEGP